MTDPGGKNGIKEEIKRGLLDKGYDLEFDIVYHEISNDQEIANFLFVLKENYNITCKKLLHGSTQSLVYILEDISEKNGDIHLLFGDTTYGEAHKNIIEQYKGRVNLVIHECTFENSLKERSQRTGHSNSEMVVDFCKKLEPKNVFITHFSSRYHPLGTKDTNKWSLDTIKREVEGYPIKMAEELEIYKIK